MIKPPQTWKIKCQNPSDPLICVIVFPEARRVLTQSGVFTCSSLCTSRWRPWTLTRRALPHGADPPVEWMVLQVRLCMHLLAVIFQTSHYFTVALKSLLFEPVRPPPPTPPTCPTQKKTQNKTRKTQKNYKCNRCFILLQKKFTNTNMGMQGSGELNVSLICI